MRGFSYSEHLLEQYDLVFRRTRAMDPSLYPGYLAYRKVRVTEYLYRIGKLKKRQVVWAGNILKKRYRIKYYILSNRHVVFIPYNREILFRSFFEYPQILAIYGNRHSGKTVTAWTIALEFLERFPNSRVYVYGDVDGISAVMRMRGLYPGRIIAKNDNTLPPVSDEPMLLLFNELNESTISKMSMTKEAVDADLHALRSRHKNSWIIYNAVVKSLLQKSKRLTADLTLYKWMTWKQIVDLIKGEPKPFRDLLQRVVPKLRRNEGLFTVDVEGKGTYYAFFETNPSPQLLKLHRLAKKNVNLMLSKDEKRRKVNERLIQLMSEGLGPEEVRVLLRQEFGVELTHRQIIIRWNRYRRLMENDDEKNK